MNGSLIFGVFFLWIVALKTVAICEHRSLPVVSAGILAFSMTIISHFGGAQLLTTIFIGLGFFFLVAGPLWLLQRSSGVIVYLSVAVLATGLLFFGLPTVAEWIEDDTMAEEDADA